MERVLQKYQKRALAVRKRSSCRDVSGDSSRPVSALIVFCSPLLSPFRRALRTPNTQLPS